MTERDTDFIIWLSHQGEQTESRDNMWCRGTSSNKASNLAQINYSQANVHTLEENIVSKMQSEVDNVMTSVEIRVQDAVLTAIENLVIPRMELAMKSANVQSEQSVNGNILEPEQEDFLGNIEGLGITAFGKTNSHTDLNGIDETRANIAVAEGDLLVNERNIDRQTHAVCIMENFLYYGKHDLTTWIVKSWEKRRAILIRKINLMFIKNVIGVR